MKRLAMLLLVGLAGAITVSRPPQGTYCTPQAFRDFQVLVGRQAVVRPTPGCSRPALVRKVGRNGGAYTPTLIDVGMAQRIWLFTTRLEYTLDGVHWHPLVVR